MKQDVAAYYSQTQNHYQRWWQLNNGMALHYGVWHEDTRSFLESLNNTNKLLAELAKVGESQSVLDAGCGVGGSSIFLAKNYNVNVNGISLSELQIETANKNSIISKTDHLTTFTELDFCNTNFKNESFDVIWACESSTSAPNKKQMAAEWFRLLKPGGKLVLTDFFKVNDNQYDRDHLLDKWTALWAMSPLVTNAYFNQQLEEAGYEINQTNNLTNKIFKSARRMYHSYWFGLVPSLLYNSVFGASRYARNHYKSGLYQYKSLQQGLWEYNSILAIKPDLSSD